MIFQRLWEESGIQGVIRHLLAGRKFEFDVERAIFLTVLHRLMTSGSDRHCDRWKRDYLIPGTEELELHHLYRAMTFLGESITDEDSALGPRRNKDLIEEMMFQRNKDLFSELDLVFFDTTSIYFEGQGGDFFGNRGFSKDHRPDLHQMVVGAVLDDNGRPVCCEMWPGNTTDVKTMIPVVDRLRHRFGIGQFCIVADRGMISSDTISKLEARQLPHILGTRMRRVKEVKAEILTRAGRYKEVYPENADRSKPSPLKVKEVIHNDTRYIICLNERQARKDAADRQTIIESLKKQLKKGPKALVGNKGYRKYLKVQKDSAQIDTAKIEDESRFDGKWVLTTNTNLTPEQVALKYKELWRVERVFRDVKSLLDTRPVYHQKDENIASHVFCSFLALVLRKDLDRSLAESKHQFEWNEIKQDLKALKQVGIEEGGQRFAIRSECKGICGKIFQTVGVALPPTIKALN
ncbi:IS1634 family transposase [uncultured Desulfobacter sp.]|uniref:IS1634 family transposase n=2 Tax=uncultured Desulfobacter sp. TaxID=240139 RepID=UPI002AA8BF3B|nr:IS1634 family transposase [uncultured Desulfobacter sp.]